MRKINYAGYRFPPEIIRLSDPELLKKIEEAEAPLRPCGRRCLPSFRGAMRDRLISPRDGT
jgi:hypothetical protein